MIKQENIFAKIVEVNGYQVVITKQPYNEEDEAYEIKFSTMVSSGFISATVGHGDEAAVNSQFNNPEAFCKQFLEGLLENLKDD